ncbi:MAG: hypothetical protein A3F43_05380 [Gammaproteobacteria bacterium RIFCSPHIGHO2_12_FULL_42_10]|nr:MAG: hypothetical protein A3F43_05380 [Gammaproteobacteria bacterium RIFCSPHIGHO2_12_FULL_42_10]
MAPQLAINIFNKLKRASKPRAPIPKAVWYNPLYFLAFGLGSGAIPIAPGTFGTLVAIPCYLLLRNLSLTYYILFVILFIAASSVLSDYISRKIHEHDHPGMCIDEFAGFFVTMINAPYGISWIILGFILFRLFDIWKPWPIRWIDQHINNGFGMILDDVVAGLFAMVMIQGVHLLR